MIPYVMMPLLLAAGYSTSGLPDRSGSIQANHADQDGQIRLSRRSLSIPSSLAGGDLVGSRRHAHAAPGLPTRSDHRVQLASLTTAKSPRSMQNDGGDRQNTPAPNRRQVLAQASAKASAATPPPAAGDDLAKLAQKANNPISDAWLLISQNDTTLIGGDEVDGRI